RSTATHQPSTTNPPRRAGSVGGRWLAVGRGQPRGARPIFTNQQPPTTNTGRAQRQQTAEPPTMTSRIPTLDIRRFDSDREGFVAELGAAYREWALAGVAYHGFAQSLVDEAYAAFRRFFALPEEAKRRCHLQMQGGARGYTPFGIEIAKGSQHYDLKEFYHIG